MKNLPFARPGRFYRGNLHTHSTNSDGIFKAEEVCRHYREAGYDFISISEHFIDRFNYPITNTSAYQTDNFTTLIAAELHQGKIMVGDPWHILAVGIPFDFARPEQQETGPEIAQRAADAGAFIGIVHPSWYGLTTEDAKTISSAHAVEIYNHGSSVEVERGEGWPFCDLLLNEGWRLSGFATDDAHKMTHDTCGGWINVRAESLDPKMLLDAMKAGQYYSSQGPEIHDIHIKGGELHIECTPAVNISLQGRGSRSEYISGERLNMASFRIKKFEDAYVRVTVRDELGNLAWSNPIWFH